MKITEERLEAAARAVGRAMGYEFSGASVLEAASSGNPRAAQWREIARAALSARKPRAPKAD